MKVSIKLSQIIRGSILRTLFVLITSSILTFCSSGGIETPSTNTNTSTNAPVNVSVPPENPPVVSSSGVTAPDFNLKNVDGNSVKLSDFKGKVVTLFFLGNSCPFCKSAAPSIESKLKVSYSSRSDYAILGLDQWDGNVSAVKSFISSTSVTFPVLLNASSVAQVYKTTYDRLLVVDKNGKIAFVGMRGSSADIDLAKTKVDELLK